MDEAVKALLETGKCQGYLTYRQVNDGLPDDPFHPEKLDQILLLLEEQGIELIEESEGEHRTAEHNAVLPQEETSGDHGFGGSDENNGGWSDDPLRQYLTQMGAFPLLQRPEEIALAKRIDVTRQRFRCAVLECPGALRQVVDTLQQVQTGQLSFDRTIRTSCLEKDQILQRLPHNLHVLEQLIAEHEAAFCQLLERNAPAREQRKLCRSLCHEQAVLLVEELHLRTEMIRQLVRSLEPVSARLDEIAKQMKDLKGERRARGRRASLARERRSLMLLALEEPVRLRRRIARMKQRYAEYANAKRALAAGNQWQK